MHSPWFTHPWCSLRCLLPSHRNYPCLKLIAQAPENGCLEDEVSFWGPAYFQQPITMLVSGVYRPVLTWWNPAFRCVFFSQATWADVVCQPFFRGASAAVFRLVTFVGVTGWVGATRQWWRVLINGRSPGIGSHWSWIYRVVKGGGSKGRGFPNLP